MSNSGWITSEGNTSFFCKKSISRVPTFLLLRTCSYLPEVEDPDDLALLLLRALVEVVEGVLHVLGEPGREDVLLGAELVPRLAHDGVDDVEAGDLVLGPALLDELLHALHHVLVELDGLDGALRDGRHLGLGDGGLQLVQRRELRRGLGHWLRPRNKPHSPPG
jgi:hypothetical protein